MPRLHTDVFRAPGRPQQQTPYGLEFGYSAPVEPQSGRGWRKLIWHNRPCCFLQFSIFRPRGASVPPDLRPASLGGRRGLIRYATGYGLNATVGYWWSNHTWFFWHDHGAEYAASLHYFGAGTTRLLGRLIAELRPANELKPHGPIVVQPAKFRALPRLRSPIKIHLSDIVGFPGEPRRRETLTLLDRETGTAAMSRFRQTATATRARPPSGGTRWRTGGSR